MHPLSAIIIFLLTSLLFLVVGWWQLNNHHQPPIAQQLPTSDDARWITIYDALQNEPMQFDYPQINPSAQYVYQLILGRYRNYDNAIKIEKKLKDTLGKIIIKQNHKGLWELYSMPIHSRNQLDLIKIKLNRLGITPQQFKQKITPD